MTAYGISIHDTASPALEALLGSLDDPALLTTVGEAGKLILMDHFQQKDASAPHRIKTIRTAQRNIRRIRPGYLLAAGR